MRIKSVFELLVAGICGYFALDFYLSNNLVYAAFLLLAALVFIALFIRSLFRMTNPYHAELNKILRTYDSILVEVEVIPKMSDKKMVRTKSFKDMVNVQFEVRKPIYYLRGPLGCTFVIMSEDTAYIYEIYDTSYQNMNNPVNDEKK